MEKGIINNEVDGVLLRYIIILYQVQRLLNIKTDKFSGTKIIKSFRSISVSSLAWTGDACGSYHGFL
jgi:hypothetical protein